MFDVIVVTETWLNKLTDHTFDITNYSKFSIYRNRSGGGVSLYYANSLDVCLLPNLTFINEFLEVLTVRVRRDGRDLLVTGLYRCHGQSIASFNENFEENVLTRLPLGTDTIVCGDFNVNIFNPLKLNPIYDFVQNLASFGFFPVINKATRIDLSNPITKFSLLDQIWINFSASEIVNSGVIDAGISDHLTPYLLLSTDIPPPQTSCFRPVNNRNCIAKFTALVSRLPLVRLSSAEDPGDALRAVLTALYDAYYKCFPLRQVRPQGGRISPPWMTRQLKSLIRKKYRMLALYRRCLISRRSFNVYRNMLNALVKSIKRLYFSNKLREASGDVKATWKILNKVLGRKVRSTIKLVDDTGGTLADGEVAERFNCHFTSIADRLLTSLPANAEQRRMTTAPVPHSCFLVPTTPQEITDVLASFKNKKYHKNEIQPSILLLISHIVCPILSKIYNRCIYLGHYPKILKKARVIPIFKSGDTNELSNFRPISTLSIFNKLFEKLIHVRLASFFLK